MNSITVNNVPFFAWHASCRPCDGAILSFLIILCYFQINQFERTDWIEKEFDYRDFFIDRICTLDSIDYVRRCADSGTERFKGRLCDLQHMVSSTDRRTYDVIYRHRLVGVSANRRMSVLRLLGALSTHQKKKSIQGGRGHSAVRRLLYSGDFRLPVLWDGADQLPPDPDWRIFGSVLSVLDNAFGAVRYADVGISDQQKM